MGKDRKDRREKLNEEITLRTVRIIGDDATDGVIPLSKALEMAKDRELDLVLMSEANGVGICRIVDYQKYLYELAKKEKDRPKALDIKEIKVGPNTGEHDLAYRIKSMTEFLQKGHKVKITMQFRGREIAHLPNGEKLMASLVLSIENFGVVETPPKLEGKRLSTTIRPRVLGK